MPRRLRSTHLETRTSRLKLEPRGKPHWRTVAPGISVGYRAGPGTWTVRCADGRGSSWTKRLGLADDREDADGTHVLDFWMAIDKAKALARGQDADAGRPASVAEAFADYSDDLRLRGAGKTNATTPCQHLPPSLLSRPISLLTVRELKHWRNGLAAKLKASTVNRICRSTKAAFNLAASHDDRITNAKAWTIGLATLPEANDTESNMILSDEQRRAVIASAYDISADFGIYTEIHAVTGARTSQIALLDVADLHTGAKPLLTIPSSLKGRNRRTRIRKPIPISPGLAQRLKVIIAGRAPDQPLLMMTPDGRRWNAGAHHKLFAAAAKAASLPAGASIYALRHTAITKALLAGVAVRLVASSFDTSIAMIERSYSKYISDHGDDQMRRALFDTDAPSNIVSLVR
jgi:integrase